MQFGVTFEDIQNASISCHNTADQIQIQLGVLKNYVLSLGASYLGMASQTFEALMTDYDVYSQLLNQALVDIGEGLHGNFVNYTDTENAIISRLQAVNGAIPGAKL
jgi:WXG100 family type VII secretion target